MRTIQDVFKSERQAWLDDARAEARRQLKRKPIITIEEVLANCPRPQFLHKNATGNVFKHEDFIPVGWRKSQRPAMNGRYVRTWRLKNN